MYCSFTLEDEGAGRAFLVAAAARRRGRAARGAARDLGGSELSPHPVVQQKAGSTVNRKLAAADRFGQHGKAGAADPSDKKYAPSVLSTHALPAARSIRIHPFAAEQRNAARCSAVRHDERVSGRVRTRNLRARAYQVFGSQHCARGVVTPCAALVDRTRGAAPACQRGVWRATDRASTTGSWETTLCGATSCIRCRGRAPPCPLALLSDPAQFPEWIAQPVDKVARRACGSTHRASSSPSPSACMSLRCMTVGEGHAPEFESRVSIWSQGGCRGDHQHPRPSHVYSAVVGAAVAGRWPRLGRR
jgi:hypothetical protein